MTRSLNCVFAGKSASAIPGGEFKEWIVNEANNLAITGWVRSLHDDRLEVLAQGTEENLEEFRVHLLQGPPFSKVENLECKWIEYEKSFSAFELRQ
ncbi:acylphosphatase [Desulfonatronum sp. SC1]|uniref:acylphosphatase n=1 Tax=Desulfonatronum sp. SC1 TaxID=2109626 RepID=UPI000D301130|nr:acylphosphatase [Desulfonatronum sp. SC1]PTN32312.1 acylphosphatase [Desulfonatronum sp. SC1]